MFVELCEKLLETTHLYLKKKKKDKIKQNELLYLFKLLFC